jgi:hypothetical protein
MDIGRLIGILNVQPLEIPVPKKKKENTEEKQAAMQTRKQPDRTASE